MANKMISMRVDEDTIKEFDDFCTNIGADRSTLVTMFMKFCINQRALPFRVAESYKYPTFDE